MSWWRARGSFHQSLLLALGPPLDRFTHTRGGTLRRRGLFKLASKGVVICAAPPASPDAVIAVSHAWPPGGLNSTHHTPPYFSHLENILARDLASFFPLFSLSCPCFATPLASDWESAWAIGLPSLPYKHVFDTSWAFLDTDHAVCPFALPSARPRPFLGIASSLGAVR